MGESADALIEEILSDARKKAERSKRKARRKAEKIVSDAEEEAEQERERILQQAREKAESEQHRIQALIPQQKNFIQSEAVETLLEHVRQEGMEKARTLVDSDEYEDILCGLAVSAIEQMAGDEFILLLTKNDAERFGEEIAGKVVDALGSEIDRDVTVRLGADTIDASGGLKVVSADGHQICDETFEGRLERMWSRLRQEVAETLTDGDLKSLYAIGEIQSD